MATRKSSRRPHHVDHHGHAAATLEAPVSARCELGDCSGCHGEVLSLPPGRYQVQPSLPHPAGGGRVTREDLAALAADPGDLDPALRRRDRPRRRPPPLGRRRLVGIRVAASHDHHGAPDSPPGALLLLGVRGPCPRCWPPGPPGLTRRRAAHPCPAVKVGEAAAGKP